MGTAEHKPISASLIEEAAVRQIDVTHDVVNAKPGVKALKDDVFLPMGAGNLAHRRHHRCGKCVEVTS